MRKHLMLSTAAIGLMLASGLAYAQAPGERRDEPKRTEEPARGATQQHGGSAQERIQERAQGAQERLQGAGREDKGGTRHQAGDEKNQPATAAERNQPKAKEKAKDQAQESREPGRDRNREAESAKQGRERDKSSAETKQDKSAPQKSTAESEKSRTGPAAQQNERNQNQPPRNAAEQQRPAASQDNRPATATDTSRTAPANNAQTAPPAGTQTNQANQTTQTNTQAQVNSEKQVRISETVSRARLAEPERNLNVSIRVGETIPSRVRLYRLPPEIVSIEPGYRDYEYFATDQDVVIVEPRTHRIVSQVPRDPSRARAQMGGSAGQGMAAAGGSNVNCRIMRRDASGNVAEAEPSTVGSTARTDSLSVTVQMPGGGSSAPIALGTTAGDIVVATQGQGDCTVTIEPQTR
ncbi:DUF1236 domain-containing protein [Bradyrhizobium liaoningense]|uniref:DUF1236 domain-containing protein n=1 Tax=Bradyrhizobium liaoningense TaxID=43992 RepID=UPI001BA9BFE6|nr:DUF1236 domain-containing protein [Bradyrhizobium liaoningense]MBR0839857.1 DUF1236 domain-containing protein [Bradyrhizobium liaoningense]